MFLHHTMTDSEILRSCEGCTSPHLRLVSDRLRARVEDLREIQQLCAMGQRTGTALTVLTQIEVICRGEA